MQHKSQRFALRVELEHLNTARLREKLQDPVRHVRTMAYAVLLKRKQKEA